MRKGFLTATLNEIDMSSLEEQRVDRAKEVLVRWMGGENLDIAAKEIARLVKFEIDLRDYSKASGKDGLRRINRWHLSNEDWSYKRAGFLQDIQ